MKKLAILLGIFGLSVIMLACQSDKETTTTQSSTVSSSSQTTATISDEHSITDFYNELVSYENRLDVIVTSMQLETRGYQKISPLLLEGEELTETITRDEILAVHYTEQPDRVYSNYFEQLITTLLVVTNIREMIEDQSAINLNEPFNPNDDSSITYEFIYSESGYILIDALYRTEHFYLKLGTNDDLLEYQELHYYYYSSMSIGSNDDLAMSFNYFKFTENKEAIYVNYAPDNASLCYTSIENDEQFTISYGDSVIEQIEGSDKGYVLSRYNRELNVQSYLQVINDEIVSETYDIFDEYGQVYRYEDLSLSDELITLQINFATATGWDYVVVSPYSNSEIDELTGIYTSDGTKLYDGRLNYTYTPTYGFLGLWMNLDGPEMFTDDIFSLSQFGLSLSHPKANLEFFNQVNLDNFPDIKDYFHVENLDFFAEDLQTELYQYIDQDILNDLEGGNEPPIVTTGDVEAFNLAISQFEDEFLLNPSFNSEALFTMTIKDENTTISETTTRSNGAFDLSALFYRQSTRVIANGIPSFFAYVIDGTRGPLVEFEINNPVAQYQILASSANTMNFLEAYYDFSGGIDMSNVVSITNIDDFNFDLIVTSRFLSEGGVDLSILLEQQGIQGLDGQTITIHYQFSEDFTNYQVAYSITGLALLDYDVEITSSMETQLEPITIISPFDQESLLFYLPTSIDSILFTTYPSQTRWILDEGTYYLKLELEASQYSVEFRGDHLNPEFVILDELLNEIPYDQRFTAPYSGTYYVEITSSSKQGVDIIVDEDIPPVFVNSAIESTDGTLELTVDLVGVTGSTIDIPMADYDRILVISPYFIGEVTEDDTIDITLNDEINFSFDGCMLYNNPESWMTPSYFYIPKDRSLQFELNGYFTGTFGFDYSYITVPSSDNGNTYDWTDTSLSPIIFMLDDAKIARLNLTITEQGHYQLSTYYEDFGYSYQYAILYKADGTQVDYNWVQSLLLEAGDYYIEFTPYSYDKVFVLVIPTLTRID